METSASGDPAVSEFMQDFTRRQPRASVDDVFRHWRVRSGRPPTPSEEAQLRADWAQWQLRAGSNPEAEAPNPSRWRSAFEFVGGAAALLALYAVLFVIREQTPGLVFVIAIGILMFALLMASGNPEIPGNPAGSVAMAAPLIGWAIFGTAAESALGVSGLVVAAGFAGIAFVACLIVSATSD